MKWMQRILGFLFLTLCVVSLTLMTTWYTVNEALKKWMNEPLASTGPAGDPLPLEVFSLQTSGSENIEKEQAPAKSEPPQSTIPVNPLQTPYSPDGTAAISPETEAGKVVVTAEQFAFRKEALTNQERLRIYELFTRHLPEKQLKSVSEWLENGLTSDEIRQLEALLKNYFPEKARAEIESIWLRWQPLPTASDALSAEKRPRNTPASGSSR